MINSLKNKRALVTGAGQGLGEAITRHLIEAGADVAIHYRSSAAGAQSLREHAQRLGRRAEIFQAHLTDEAAAARLVEDAVRFLGGLDVLVNNAGDLVQRRSIEQLDPDYWARTLAVNLNSMVWVTRAAVPVLAKAGGASIVNLASLAGRKGGHPGSLAYSTAKGAVLTWTRALAAELADRGIASMRSRPVSS